MVESLKILILSYWFPPKIAPAPYELAKHLAKLGHEVFVCAGTFNHASSNEELEGVRVIRFKQYFPSFPGHITYGLKVAKKLVELHKRERFDVIHAHGADGWFTSKLGIKRKLDIPIIVTMHGSAQQELNALKIESPHPLFSSLEKMHWWAQYFLDKWSLEGADRVIAVSKQTANEVARDYGFPLKKMAIIYNGVDSTRFFPGQRSEDIRRKFAARNHVVVLFVGRLRMRKGVQYLIKALPSVLKRENNITLLIVGDGESRIHIQNLTQKLALQNHVRFLGKVSNGLMPKIYASSDIFVLPSLYEGFPLVALESMASGLPIIASKVSGIPEVVDNESGVLVNPRDISGLAEALCELIANDDGRRKIAEYVRRKAIEGYSWSRIAEQTVQVYKRAIEERA